MADHNDPNAVNSIFSDIDHSPADLYDMFGYPVESAGEETVFIALTFAPVPSAGVFDTDMLYRIMVKPRPRPLRPTKDDWSLETLLKYFEAIKDQYLGNIRTPEIRFKVGQDQRATINFIDFPGGSFALSSEINKVVELKTPDGFTIKGYFGGRDDAFFNDLPGFFRSINYAPQFYHVPHTMTEARELPIPKTLLELEGNDLFNFNPAEPDHGVTMKKDLPPGPWTWKGNAFKKDANGNYRFVYSGKDAQAGKNINCIALEVPLRFITRTPEQDRIVNCWGESWVAKAAHKIETVPDDRFWLDHPWILLDSYKFDDELKHYKLIDTDGQPFADAALSEREDSRQVGANNFWLGPTFVKRLAHLGWGFGPSISALGLACAFDHDNSPVSILKFPNIIEAFPRVKKVLFQELNMPDDSWNPKKLNIPLRRPFEIFVPNVAAIDMDTTGTWPFGRRLEDQVATRFLSMFLDHSAKINGKQYNIELMGQQWLWDATPIEPKTPPNPLKNDVEFLTEFPYFAPPHSEDKW
jgi:hypothetical protein